MADVTEQTLGDGELVLGLVYPTGIKALRLLRRLEDGFAAYAYDSRLIHLSKIVADHFDGDCPDDLTEHQRITRLQNLGDRLRRRVGNEVFADVAVAAIADRRAVVKMAHRRVWIIRSLKRPEEVRRLRLVYGRRFLALSVHSPESQRVHDLAEEIARSSGGAAADYRNQASDLIQRDQSDSRYEWGQNVRDAFPEADYFLSARSDEAVRAGVTRFLEILFGAHFATPTMDEYAMAMARSAGLRSAEMGRQVGAAITTPRGQIIATGTNEVPAFGGGLYWHGDPHDARDFQRGVDANDDWKLRVAQELRDRLAGTGWLRDPPQLPDEAPRDGSLTSFVNDLRGTRVRSLIEFGRAVHAEMDALTDAARRGVAVEGATLYTTTFPCHNCARHVIAAGIVRVVFIVPYAKSLAVSLHDDAITVDGDAHGQRVCFDQYLGVAPGSYGFYFEAGDRKDASGVPLGLDRRHALPRPVWPRGFPPYPREYISEAETQITGDVAQKVFGDDDLRLFVSNEREPGEG